MRAINVTWFTSRLTPLLVGACLATQAATTNSWLLDANGYWNNPGNWDPTGVPNGVGSAALITNTITANRLITSDVNVTLGALEISGNATYNFSITNDPGVTWRMENGGQGVSVTGNGAGTSTTGERIWVPIEIAEDLSVYTASKAVTFSGAITESGGTRKIVKTGSGYMTLGSESNAFTGGVLVKAGSFIAPATSTTSKVGTGSITLGDSTGASAANIIGNGTYTNAVIVASGSTGKKTMRNSGTGGNLTFAGPVILNDDVEFNAGSATGYTYVSGAISGDRTITVTSTGSNNGRGTEKTNYVRLGALNSDFTGVVKLQSGNLRLSGHEALGKGSLIVSNNTILSSDGNSNRQLTNNVMLAGNFITFAHTNGGAGTLVIWGDTDLGSDMHVLANGGTVSHTFRGNIFGTGGLTLQDTNTSASKYFLFYGNNTYSGGFKSINAMAQFYGDSAFGTGPMTLGDAATVKNVQLLGYGLVTNDISIVAGVSGNRLLACNTDNSTAHFSGSIDLGADLLIGSGTSARATVLSGTVTGSGSLTFQGGALTTFGLSGANSYAGTTTVTGGTLYVTNTTGSATGAGAVTVQTNATLAGTGFIGSPATFNDGATLAPGVGGIGTLTFSDTLTLSAASTNVFDVSKALATNDTVVANSVAFAGTLVVNNVSGELGGGETFKLFSTTGANSGNFSEIVVLGSTATAQFDPATGIVSFQSGMASYPTNITTSFNSSTSELTLTWPETHKGWIMQSNSVSVGDSTSWYNVNGSEAVTTLTVPVNTSTPKVFYRLLKP